MAWRMNLREVFTEYVDCTDIEVGINKKLQIKNRSEVKAQLRRGERLNGRLNFHSRRMEDSSSPPEEKNESPLHEQPIVPRHVPILGE